MKIFTALRLSLGLSLALIISHVSLGQAPVGPVELRCGMLPLDPTERAQQASLVVEAEVLDARGFWDSGHQRIYTAHRVRVYKSFKGEAPAELTVLTEGGTVDFDREQSTNTLRLTPGDQGILFLYAAPFAGTEAVGTAWTAYASEQGFIRYDLTTGTAAEPFRQYPLIGPDFYAGQSAVTGQALREVQPNANLGAALARRSEVMANRGTASPAISSLSPRSLTAGTGAVLTISGSGFGNTRGTGYVEFKNADDGGDTYIRPLDTDYVSWTDTQIRVVAPSYGTTGSPAGTGVVRVTTSDATQTTSATAITIVYALTNVQADQDKLLYRPGHINQNEAGGYTFRFDASFAANTAANSAWQRALATWRCQTGVNWQVGATRTKTGIANDDENSVGFDNGAELPAKVLGRTTSYYTGCRSANGAVVFWVDEIDTQFDDARSWQFGPARATLAQYDFESVAVHELGHAQQLAHLILPSAVMHYAISNGANSRTINATSDVAGGRLVLRTRSFVAPVCNPVPMLPAPLTTVAARTLGATGVQVTWTTRDECFLNTSQAFEVQRAADTTAWQTLATLPAGATSNAYSYVDAQPLTGVSYYRLRLRRPDGSLDNAPPVGVTDDILAATDLQLFPNPVVDGTLRLLYTGTASGSLSLFFYDVLGRYYAGYGVKYGVGLNQLALQIENLRAGLYLVRWRDASGRSGTSRVLKLNQ
ncbi:matrixin family metalloprotease [Hymenobacter cavernae]|uniref:T9SS C-terminal target domain-containing protein n=1 Tax=Hymenobacter cavernae TaxID=2044852 RepID=A0ABQ1TZE0_9BACT|nr:matrixin family metalloprotease [Hymenobacter cavernae]GGF05375.1 hypothetical protein GCM10011383_15640 [Hymenobacter cavernae]